MTDRPIIFSAPMVAALLAGRKTQTRRLATSPLRRVQAGDRLWVRESGIYYPGVPGGAGELFRHDVPASAERGVYWSRNNGGPGAGYMVDGCSRASALARNAKVRPSIHMPRWASRLTLHVEGVKVEPVQSISNADAWSEGVCQAVETDGRAAFGETCSAEMRRMIVETIYGSGARAFNWLWDSLHTKTGETWSDNPLVIALTFRVERGNIDQLARTA